jgi:hypothetical protein
MQEMLNVQQMLYVSYSLNDVGTLSRPAFSVR